MKRALAASAVVLAACGTSPQAQTVVCTDFQVGADLAHASFGVTGVLAPSYDSLAQATGDLATASATMQYDVYAACEELARGIGAADPNADGATWCAAAAARLEALRPRLAAAGFRLAAAPSSCVVDVEYQTKCEARCRRDPGCVEPSVADRCAPADRVGSCSGVCTGSCDVALAIEYDVTRPIAHCDGLCRGGCTTPLADVVCANALAPPRCDGDADCAAACAASALARATCSPTAVRARIDDGSDPELVAAATAIGRSAGPILSVARGRARELHDATSSLVGAAGRVLAKGDSLGAEGAACGVLIGKTGQTAEANFHAVADAVDRIDAALRTP